MLTATDAVDLNPQILVADTGSSFVAGPHLSGTTIKLVQAPRGTLSVKAGSRRHRLEDHDEGGRPRQRHRCVRQHLDRQLQGSASAQVARVRPPRFSSFREDGISRLG
jgi:hypothetical protein